MRSILRLILTKMFKYINIYDISNVNICSMYSMPPVNVSVN